MAMVCAHKVVVLTKEYQRDHAAMCGWFFNRAKTAVVPNGIDLDRFAPSSKLPTSRRGG
jgi:glycosyltransferase involved in cell wall biosynthesis